MRYTKKQFEAEYPDDDACLEAVFQNRFGDLKFCPKCGAETKFYRIKKRQAYACEWCAYQLHPLADTIFRKTTTPLKDWFYAIYLVSVSKNGVSAKELERHLGVTYKTAWRMAKQIRLLMAQEAEQLTGNIEADETYIGGKNKNRHWDKKTKDAQGRSLKDKSAVFGAVERGGAARAQVIKLPNAKTVLSIIEKRVAEGSHITTDEWRAYRGLERMDYKHSRVTHMSGDYVVNGQHTNTIEGFWSQLKRSIDGTYHCVSKKYLQQYVNEFVFRYNFRDVAVCPVLLELAAKPV